MLRIGLIILASITSLAVGQDARNTNGDDIGVKIIGSIVQKDEANNVALIKIGGSKVTAVKRGHIIDDKFKVLNVTDKYMEIANKQSVRYFVFLDKFNTANMKNGPQKINSPQDFYSEEGFERQNDKIVMSGMYRDKLLKQDMATVLMQATAEPHLVNGNIVGFKMSQIDEGSIYEKSGLRNGDIIKVINGNELTSVAGSITLLRSLKKEKHFELEILRGGTSKRIVLQVQE